MSALRRRQRLPPRGAGATTEWPYRLMPDRSGPPKLGEARLHFKDGFSMSHAPAIGLFALTRVAQQRTGGAGVAMPTPGVLPCSRLAVTGPPAPGRRAAGRASGARYRPSPSFLHHFGAQARLQRESSTNPGISAPLLLATRLPVVAGRQGAAADSDPDPGYETPKLTSRYVTEDIKTGSSILDRALKGLLESARPQPRSAGTT